MFTSQPSIGTAGAYFPWPTMESESNPSLPMRSLDFSNACMAMMGIQAAESPWPSVSASWSNTGGESGFRNPYLAEDQPSASPPAAAPDRGTQEPDRSQRVGGTVLLVEDNATDVFVIKKVLADCGPGLDVRVARDGQEALGYIRALAADPSAVCPALVLLDLNIPKITGREILRELRSGARCNLIPVIIVTSSGAEADRAAAKVLSADGYFKKPTSIAAYKELGELVRRILDKAKHA